MAGYRGYDGILGDIVEIWTDVLKISSRTDLARAAVNLFSTVC